MKFFIKQVHKSRYHTYNIIIVYLESYLRIIATTEKKICLPHVRGERKRKTVRIIKQLLWNLIT